MTGAETTIVAKALENSQTDPFMSGLLYVLGGVILMITISRPIMNLIKSYKVDAADNAKANAESALFGVFIRPGFDPVVIMIFPVNAAHLK